MIARFEEGGGRGKPKLEMVHVCWAETRERAVDVAHEIWPVSALTGSLNTELATPEDFEGHRGPVEGGRGENGHEAGFDHVYLHQVGRDQEGFFRFWEQELRPALEGQH